MGADDDISRLRELRKKVAHHSEKYYQDDSPEITDSKYDALKKEYDDLCDQFPELGFTKTIGSAPSKKFSRVKHQRPMLSLQNVFSKDDFLAYIKKLERFLGNTCAIEFFCEEKIDGLSFSAIYKNGEFALASTRGNGYFGEDITRNMSVIKNFPKKLKNAPENLEIRGEIFISHEDFKNLKGFATPRNAAAGSVRQLDPEVTRARNLRYFAYHISEFKGVNSQKDAITVLEDLGFAVNQNHISSDSVEEIMQFYDKTFTARSHLDYDIDGVVYKVNSFHLQERLGFLQDSPRWAMAHKFPSYKAKTTLNRIMLSVGRTGVVTPVAELQPINIGGVIVSRASLHNKDEITRKDIREGDTVTVERAGDVIPKVISAGREVGIDRPRFIFPDICPVCESKLAKNDDEVAIRCPSSLFCRAQVIQKIKHFVSRDALNIDGLGEKNIVFLLGMGFIKNIVDIFFIDESKDEIKKFQGWGDKSVANLLDSIRKAKNTTLDRFIFSMGINHIGQKTSKILAEECKSFDHWMVRMLTLKKGDVDGEINNLHGIGSVALEALIEFFSDNHNAQIVKKLSSILNIADVEKHESISKLSKKKIAFSGKLSKLTRQEAKLTAERNGAIVLSAISSSVNYLVAGDDCGSKLKKAHGLGIVILTEDEFLALSCK